MKRYIYYIFLLLITWSCEDYYVPELEKYPDALVVDGILTDQSDYTTIRLTRSANFDEPSSFVGEKGAIVTIESDNGESYSTKEISRGFYQTVDQIKTSVGVGYWLKIITSDGTEYRSNVEKMPSPNPVDSIYLTDTVFRDVDYDFWGDPIVQDYDGITFSVIPHTPDTDDVGFLYKWDALSNYYVVAEEGPMTLNYYCWKVKNSTQIYVYDLSPEDDNLVELPLSDIHFLSYHSLGPLPIDSSRFALPIDNLGTSSLYYKLKQFTITKEGSKFWRSVKSQSEASGKLFDPIEDQIYGNIYCVSDSSKVVFGYFNAASYSDKVIAVSLGSNKINSSKVVDLIPIPTSDEDCFLGGKPDFWF